MSPLQVPWPLLAIGTCKGPEPSLAYLNFRESLRIRYTVKLFAVTMLVLSSLDFVLLIKTGIPWPTKAGKTDFLNISFANSILLSKARWQSFRHQINFPCHWTASRTNAWREMNVPTALVPTWKIGWVLNFKLRMQFRDNGVWRPRLSRDQDL